MDFYTPIFKRKSFHLFKETGKLTDEELGQIRVFMGKVTPLYPEIRTEIQIVPESETTCKRGAEYCILFYSEKEGDYLRNIGYLGEQIDLFLAANNIGALWYGIGKPQQPEPDGMEFVIMIAIAKMEETKFRKDMFKSKRKPLEEIWQGEVPEYASIVRFAPSACNTQPWMVEAADGQLMIYRYKKPGKRGIMPSDKVTYYNRIDMGIYLFFLETCMKKEGIDFERELLSDDAEDSVEKVLAARYSLRQEK